MKKSVHRNQVLENDLVPGSSACETGRANVTISQYCFHFSDAKKLKRKQGEGEASLHLYIPKNTACCSLRKSCNM